VSDELFFWQQEAVCDDALQDEPSLTQVASTTVEPAVSGSAIDDKLRHQLQLCLLPGLGPRSLSVLIEAFGSAAAVLSADTAALTRVPGIGPKLAHTIRTAADHVDVNEVLRWCHEHRVQIVPVGDTGYPCAFEELDDTPPVLFSYGNWTSTDQFAVAIVGTRHATPYGLQCTRRLARDLAAASVTIVSGLARGVDTAAHRAALEVGGRTIAFLGGGLGQLYPAENKPLADEIAQSGAVISEYSPLSKPRAGMFPQRNRLIAAASLATLVIEAPERSGSLITARLASEMGRSVGALPGPVNSRASQGCHQLIRDGAVLVTNADDVLELLGPLSQPILRSGQQVSASSSPDATAREMRDGREISLNELELAVLDRIMPTGTALDEVTAGCGLSSARVSAIVSVLEMKRFVRRLSSQYVARV
jgi:DNA processing protein